jgi:hypothetical protein
VVVSLSGDERSLMLLVIHLPKQKATTVKLCGNGLR